ncbi:MAG: hypothetical protein IT531_04345 [Burkholderiales bacterium]|nr:hypothetical protein [Burkholderiales bacterium]
MASAPDFRSIDVDLELDKVDLSEILGAAYREVVTDGLPVVQPTRRDVSAMLAGRADDEVIAELPPVMQPCTLRALAAMAVLAGCPARVFPVLVAAVKAAVRDEFNLLAVVTTTGNVAVAMLVSGPRAAQFGLHPGCNALGPGPRANVTLGRALRFALMNIGGAVPGLLDVACLGWPGKLSFCVAEHAAANPWESFHASRGFAAGETVVTLAAAHGFIEMADAVSTSPEPLLANLGRMMAPARASGSRAGESLVLLTPQHAHICAQAGLSRAAVQARLHAQLGSAEAHVDGASGKAVRDIGGSDDILLFVAGSQGGKSALVPLWSSSRIVAAPVGA